MKKVLMRDQGRRGDGRARGSNGNARAPETVDKRSEPTLGGSGVLPPKHFETTPFGFA